MILLRNIPLDPDRDIRDEEAFTAFMNREDIVKLGWPADVARQWLWDFGDREVFRADYGSIDLSQVVWTPEGVDAADFDTMPTGPRDRDCIEEYAREHAYWVEAKARYKPEVKVAWDKQGTWLVPPVLIARSLLDPSLPGLQVVEGRTRVGILRGRRRDGLLVAPRQRAWVGRPRG
jgi:hypothetical protein